jgi:hypothetical protein
MKLTRLEFLSAGVAASAGWLLSGRLGAAAPPTLKGSAYQPASNALERISRIIEAYDSQGVHRTGTDVDDASGAWLLEQARAAGATAGLERFRLSRVDVRACSVAAGRRTIEGLPLFDGGFTPPAGVSGRLGAADSSAEIALVDLDGPAISSEGRALDALRRGGRHRAVVGITRGNQPGLTPMNAYRFREPYGLPVVQVPSTEAAWLRGLAEQGERVTVVADVIRGDDTADNVTATVRGTRADLPPVVVITPRSGWWNCASERGGGIACWLETIRAAAAARSARTVEFAASSGHELGHLGLDAFIADRRALVKSAAAWVHLGANIGAAGGRMRLQASDDQMDERTTAALVRAGTSVAARVPRGTVPAGEARNIHVGGGRYVSLLGSGPYFHSLADRWPVAVDAAAVARYAAAVADLVVTLAE